ncbi:MAG: ATP-grasp domain-containing protein [Planctomycetes bacterium]|nr:ATP-grasp domain-containing protein [Planctomycetota bacterium]
MTERLLIVGGSVRAAAMSVQRAGFEPSAIDRFADLDLCKICRSFQRFDELHQLPALIASSEATSWMFVGPLENYPDLVEQISANCRLLGNGTEVLQEVRNPLRLANALSEVGLLRPDVRHTNDLPSSGRWLRKPLRSAGGYEVERLDLARMHDLDRENLTYVQQFISGQSIGATFIGGSDGAVLVGAAEQLLGRDWGGARPYQYVGSIGPIEVSTEHREQLIHLGDFLAQHFRLKGLFGVDAIINEAGVWPVEVNPRYTASVEILERALEIATIPWHVAACQSGELPPLVRYDNAEVSAERHAKGVVYANHSIVIDERLEHSLTSSGCEDCDPTIADIPVAGTSINEGEPIVTVFAKGKTNAVARRELRATMVRMKQLFNASQRRA